jgi:uncharacterized membrane protein YhiD involved in acid resistance
MDIFNSVLSNQSTASFTEGSFFLCLGASIAFGLIIAFVYSFRNSTSKSFVMTLALLPAIVQVVIMLVNGSIGAGIAVMGAFNLVRFRSVPGSAKEICSIFLAMAVGLATGMGYLLLAGILVVVICAIQLIFSFIKIGDKTSVKKELRITIPESLDYTGVFDELFEQYTKSNELVEVKTANMGSLYKLKYIVTLKDQSQEKQFIDDLRCRNGNLEISCCRAAFNQETL